MGEGPSPGGNYPDITPDSSTVVTDGDYKYVVFEDLETFEVDATGDSSGSDEIQYLVVAGGGAAGCSGYYGPGGGAGGYLAGTETLNITGTGTATVGAGGAGTDAWPTGPANNGDDSQLELPDFTQIDALGGGGAAQFKVIGVTASIEDGQDGGSGGGGHANTPSYGSGTPGSGDAGPPRQGYDGGAGSPASLYVQGGGGGASEAGGDAAGAAGGPGGDGIENLIATTSNGDNGYYAGGGAGRGSGAEGGAGGGGGYNTSGTAFTGGGGGGGLTTGVPNGGSGVVIIRWKFQN